MGKTGGKKDAEHRRNTAPVHGPVVQAALRQSQGYYSP